MPRLVGEDGREASSLRVTLDRRLPRGVGLQAAAHRVHPGGRLGLVRRGLPRLGDQHASPGQAVGRGGPLRKLLRPAALHPVQESAHDRPLPGETPERYRTAPGIVTHRCTRNPVSSFLGPEQIYGHVIVIVVIIDNNNED